MEVGKSTRGGGISLNYNNDTDFSGKSAGSATINMPNMSSFGRWARPVLRFQCKYDTETGASYDKRYMDILYFDNEKGVLKRALPGAQLAGSGGNLTCPEKHVRHDHEAPLYDRGTGETYSWARGMAHVRFFFNAVDAIANSGAGWFVDDVKIEGGNRS